MRLSLASDSGENLMNLRPIKSVWIRYEDGTEETFFIDNDLGAGYYRHTYTWEPKPNGQGLAKWGGRVETHEIFWTERKGNNGQHA
jgi:hypothetical protein